MKTETDLDDELLTPAEVAAIFRVNAKTVTRWASQGLLPHSWTPGGHRRYRRSMIEEMLEKKQR